MTDFPFEMPTFESGSVWLAGAGPGDPGLMSLYALFAVERADAIVYDALVDPLVVQAAAPGTQIIFAGKRGGRPSASQPDISGRLVELARGGLRVLRLKGGDPFIFGRGGEEALALAEAGVPFRIVPGISAGIAGPAYAGVPLTHRGVSSAVTFLTGHATGGGEVDDPDWRSLSDASNVLVFYMPLTQLETIAARLADAGRRADAPAILISRATTPRQLVVETTLAAAAADAARAKMESPALFVVGPVVELRGRLDWVGPDP